MFNTAHIICFSFFFTAPPYIVGQDFHMAARPMEIIPCLPISHILWSSQVYHQVWEVLSGCHCVPWAHWDAWLTLLKLKLWLKLWWSMLLPAITMRGEFYIHRGEYSLGWVDWGKYSLGWAVRLCSSGWISFQISKCLKVLWMNQGNESGEWILIRMFKLELYLWQRATLQDWNVTGVSQWIKYDLLVSQSWYHMSKEGSWLLMNVVDYSCRVVTSI